MISDLVKLVVDGRRIYAESFEDLAGVIMALRADLQVTVDQQRSAVENLAMRTKQLEADLVAQREAQHWGPQHSAERDAAVEARDRALEQLEQLTQQLERERASRSDTDKTRRALAAEVRILKEKNNSLLADYASAVERADINQEALNMRAAMDKRKEKRGARARRR